MYYLIGFAIMYTLLVVIPTYFYMKYKDRNGYNNTYHGNGNGG